MKYFRIFLIAFVFTSIQVKAQIKQTKIVINLHLGSQQGTIFSYCDDFAVENLIRFKNTSLKDTIISREIFVKNVTVFKYQLMYHDRKKEYFYKFYAKPGDEINLQFDDFDLKRIDDNPYQFVSDYLKINTSIYNRPSGTLAEINSANERTLERNRQIIDSLTNRDFISTIESNIWKSIAYSYYINMLQLTNELDSKEVNEYRNKLEAFLANSSPVNDEGVRNAFLKLMYITKAENNIYTKIATISKFKINEKYKCGSAYTVLQAFPEKNSAIYKKALEFFNNTLLDDEFIKQPYARNILAQKLFDKKLIKIVNINGKFETFDDLFVHNKGKLIVVDLWATWCIPCINEIPYFEAKKRKMAANSIAFVSLSLDKDNKNSEWLTLSKKLKVTGIQARVLEKSNKTLAQYYHIEFIPRYLVFDKNGALIDDNFVKPSDPGFSKKLLNYLN